MVAQAIGLLRHQIGDVFGPQGCWLREYFGALESNRSLVDIDVPVGYRPIVGPFFKQAEFRTPLNSVNCIVHGVRLYEFL